MRNEEKEKFLSRWARLKEEARAQPDDEPARVPAHDPKAPPPELPPVDKLTIDSDFRGFFHPKVDENLRRTALKKLFSDPHFNVMDGLDVYIDDYSIPSPMPAAMLASLKQAQNILEWAKDKGNVQQPQDAAEGSTVSPTDTAQIAEQAGSRSEVAGAPVSSEAVVPGEESPREPPAPEQTGRRRQES